MNNGLGKKLTILGFGLNFIVIALGFAISNFLNLYELNNTLSMVLYSSLGIAAAGFLLMWLQGRKPLDLLTGGAIGLAALLGALYYLRVFDTYNGPIAIIYTVITSAFYLVLAIRSKNSAPLLSALLVLAFLYDVFLASFMFRIAFNIGIPYFILNIVQYIANIVCAGLCLLQAKTES